MIRELVARGTTLLLTTQYLEEADELADEIVVIDQGQVIAAGTAESLKNRIGGEVVEFMVPDRRRAPEAASAVSRLSDTEPTVDPEAGRVSIRVGSRGSEVLVQVVRELDSLGVHSEGLGIRRPSLDDVFLALTGHEAEAAGDRGATPAVGGPRARQKGRGR